MMSKISNIVETTLFMGLGNQMFQYAAGFAYARKHNKNFSYVAQSDKISKVFDVSCPNHLLLMNKVHEHSDQGVFISPTCSYFSQKMYENPKFSYLKGYFQNENYFKEFREDILKEFTFQKEIIERNKALSTTIKQENSISIHIRRGDYIKYHFSILKLEYYLEALDYIKGHDSDKPHIYIFSDDMEWCKSHIHFPENTTFVSGTSDADDLYLMTQCRHNIISNSTFSWWGAWLNQGSNKIVVAPGKGAWMWCNPFKPDHTREILPTSWQVIKSSAIHVEPVAIVCVLFNKNQSDFHNIYKSVDQKIYPYAPKQFFVLTNSKQLETGKNKQFYCTGTDLFTFKKECFQMIMSLEKELKHFKHVFFINADNPDQIDESKMNLNSFQNFFTDFEISLLYEVFQV